ncbi:MAG: LTA synthase family protein [Bacilli bacterium]|nr:LTA synthase family protein [Bacilli bacterium]
MINSTSNKTIKNVLNYFKNSEPTNQNEYTGMFKDKNLIFILAEGFNMIAVDEKLTPTLYKLTHEGFTFNNFYSPVFLSTTGGEFQATTGLIPTQEVLSNWKKNTPTIKYAIGNSFSNIGYNVQSYHNWTYTYYKRNKTMPTLGFNNYTGCGNGMEKRISCNWLPSDIDMINTTFLDYKDYEHFATYYVSVSGHAPYAYNSSGNSIALKNIDLVKDLPYSDNVKAYLATQIEFDRALESLISSLAEAGILEDTVISFVGDHYPYTLTIDEVNELSTYERDDIVEVNHSNFVIWNSTMTENINVDKVGSQIDVLPTLLNLFGIEYDSRLIVGKDILSDTPGLAIFSDRSWVSDYGTYTGGKFTLKENVALPNEDEYIRYMNNNVANRFTISGQIIKYNIYDYILK